MDILGSSGARAMRGRNARNLASARILKPISFRFLYNKHLIINNTCSLKSEMNGKMSAQHIVFQ